MAGRPISPVRHWLIQARHDSGKTYSELSKEIGVTQQAIYNWEIGKRNPSTAMAKKYAKILGLDWTKFYENDSVLSENGG